MKTELLAADERSIERAATLLRLGEVVGFPTETVYGLGADARDADAVRKIFAAKGRPGDNPLIVHVSGPRQIAPLIRGTMPDAARKLAAAFWPGPMTLLLPRAPVIPDATTAGLDTVGIRMPSHPVARALIDRADAPIAAPSANRSGKPSPTTAGAVLEDMDGRVPLILDGGACGVGLESTVVDVTCFPPRVLRPGGVTPEMITSIVGAVDVDGSALRPLKEGEVARSPGMKYRHYAPRGEVTIFEGAREAVAREICARYDAAEAAGRVCHILSLSPNAPLYGARRVRRLGENASDVAEALFSALREMDEEGAEVILSETVAPNGIGLAVMNRLGRAAGFRVVRAD